MITVDQSCPKCRAANTYLRRWSSKHGTAVERHCACGWTKTEQIQVDGVISLPLTPAEVAAMMAKIEAKAAQISELNRKGGLASAERLKEMHRVRNGLHKPYKSYKRRERELHDSDFEADPDFI